ncbi:hypothetical protein GALMADRAFT_243514 [Galerina marginata CBS 339.88]|uniref:Fibronectin type-III domain-containing protein n=1 Tax=Galerina marginata (strain CBS 339.88) TaxID=685588 RepID=A0A067T8F0_GALM3|nr:hypothetical protein GALMADRAFT_243514 [Galerina marginata CBS 339.88]
MKVFSPLVASVLFAVGAAAATEPLIVNNLYLPFASVCEAVTFTWSGGTPPYALVLAQVVSYTETNDIEQFPAQLGTNFTWIPSMIPSSIEFVLKVVDTVGNASESYPFKIEDGPDHSCLPSPPPTSSSAPVEATTEFHRIGWAEALGVCLGVLSLLLFLAGLRLYVLRRRRLAAGIDGDKENLVLDQKFQLSEFRKL